jgi:hypothetical protein
VLPYSDCLRAILTRQLHRYARGGWLWRAPKGARQRPQGAARYAPHICPPFIARHRLRAVRSARPSARGAAFCSPAVVASVRPRISARHFGLLFVRLRARVAINGSAALALRSLIAPTFPSVCGLAALGGALLALAAVRPPIHYRRALPPRCSARVYGRRFFPRASSARWGSRAAALRVAALGYARPAPHLAYISPLARRFSRVPLVGCLPHTPRPRPEGQGGAPSSGIWAALSKVWDCVFKFLLDIGSALWYYTLAPSQRLKTAS